MRVGVKVAVRFQCIGCRWECRKGCGNNGCNGIRIIFKWSMFVHCHTQDTIIPDRMRMDIRIEAFFIVPPFSSMSRPNGLAHLPPI